MEIVSPILFSVACAMFIAIAIVLLRAAAMPGRVKLLVLAGTALLSFAASGLNIPWPQRRDVVVMVDLSPSTRTAAYRDAALLQTRLKQLLGDETYRIENFADSYQTEKTIFAPPVASAVVLFSDGQFDLPPVTSPIYVVVDPNLEHTNDASIAGLEARGPSIAATVHNSGGSRAFQIMGTHDGPTSAPSGTTVLSAPIDPGASIVTARLSAGDAWPENDALSLSPLPNHGERWWVDSAAAFESYRGFTPDRLPIDPATYLSADVIVLNNISVDALSSVQQQRITQYVRDLGGGLVILGGDHAFAAGGYSGTPLDALSPLASAPPQAQRIWIVLVDSSGSMAADVNGQTRLQRASSAGVQLLHHLPPNDSVSIGSFARNVRWWSQSKSAAATSQLILPPSDISASGPTNLQAALQSIATQLDGGATCEIVIISDGDAAIDDPAALAQSLRNVRARVNLMATADASHSPIVRLVTLTVGNLTSQLDPNLWSEQAVKLARSIMPDRIEHSPASVTFTGPLATMPGHLLTLWNRTWPKQQINALATFQENGAPNTLAATWNVGAGQVSALAFPATPAEAAAMAKITARHPSDPRFRVTWSAASKFSVTVDAYDEQKYLNDENVTLSLVSESDSSRKPINFKQTGPGQYQIELPAPRLPVVAIVRAENQIISRFALAGRYASEFDAIGNNRSNMHQLAKMSGGAVIEPSQTTPIQFNWPKRNVSLVSILAALGAALIAAGLVMWKRS